MTSCEARLRFTALTPQRHRARHLRRRAFCLRENRRAFKRTDARWKRAAMKTGISTFGSCCSLGERQMLRQKCDQAVKRMDAVAIRFVVGIGERGIPRARITTVTAAKRGFRRR